MTCTMRRPTPDERDKITRCRKQIFEVERLGLLMEQAETLLPARLNDGMPRLPQPEISAIVPIFLPYILTPFSTCIFHSIFLSIHEPSQKVKSFSNLSNLAS